MGKKAFTLIELLAVVVILAVLSVISIPILTNVIENSKKSAVIADVRALSSQAKYKKFSQILDDTSNNEDIVFNCDETGCFAGDEGNKIYLEIDGEKPTSGSLTTDKNGNLKKAENLVYGNYVCYKDIDGEIDCINYLKKIIRVTLDSNGGESCTNSTIEVKFGKGNTYGTLCTPTKEDYEFEGWSLNSNGEGPIINNDTDVKKPTDHTLYAKWGKDAYTLTIDKDKGIQSVSVVGCNSNGNNTYLCEMDTTIGLTVHPLPGYKLGTWTGGNVTVNGEFTMPANDTTLSIESIAENYTIALDPNGGTGGTNSVMATYDSNSLPSITIPTKDEHELLGWTKTQNGTDYIIDETGNLIEDTDYTDPDGNWTNVGNVTLYAKWEHAVYLIKEGVEQKVCCADQACTIKTVCNMTAYDLGCNSSNRLAPTISGTTYSLTSTALIQSGRVQFSKSFNYDDVEKIEMVAKISASVVYTNNGYKRYSNVYMGVATDEATKAFPNEDKDIIFSRSGTTQSNQTIKPSADANNNFWTYTLENLDGISGDGYFYIGFYIVTTKAGPSVSVETQSVKLIYKD